MTLLRAGNVVLIDSPYGYGAVRNELKSLNITVGHRWARSRRTWKYHVLGRFVACPSPFVSETNDDCNGCSKVMMA
eukprot:496368-Amphidinium_carterae.1